MLIIAQMSSLSSTRSSSRPVVTMNPCSSHRWLTQRSPNMVGLRSLSMDIRVLLRLLDTLRALLQISDTSALGPKVR
jgi:hypothetical protein